MLEKLIARIHYEHLFTNRHRIRCKQFNNMNKFK